MQYRNEGEIQNDYGWEYITEAQYQRYIELFRSGKEALEVCFYPCCNLGTLRRAIAVA